MCTLTKLWAAKSRRRRADLDAFLEAPGPFRGSGWAFLHHLPCTALLLGILWECRATTHISNIGSARRLKAPSPQDTTQGTFQSLKQHYQKAPSTDLSRALFPYFYMAIDARKMQQKAGLLVN